MANGKMARETSGSMKKNTQEANDHKNPAHNQKKLIIQFNDNKSHI